MCCPTIDDESLSGERPSWLAGVWSRESWDFVSDDHSLTGLLPLLASPNLACAAVVGTFLMLLYLLCRGRTEQGEKDK